MLLRNRKTVSLVPKTHLRRKKMRLFNATFAPPTENLSLVIEKFSRMLVVGISCKAARGGRYLKEEEIGVAYSWDCGSLFLSAVFAASRRNSRRCSPEVGLVAEVMAFGITSLLKHSHHPLSAKND